MTEPTLLTIIMLIVCQKKIRGKKEQHFSKLFGFSLLAIWLIYNFYNFLPSNFEVAENLPLHVCDVLAVAGAIPLTGQAIATPTGEQNILLLKFWLFWLLHAGIILASVYDFVVRRFIPVFTDYLTSIACALFYLLVIFPFNLIFNFNYGFVGNSSPDVPTILDVFGAWPLRVVWMFGAVAFVQLLMYLLWRLMRRSTHAGD